MLNQGVVQVSNVVQTNSATAEESASASVELSAQAELLQEAVRQFRVWVYSDGQGLIVVLRQVLGRIWVCSGGCWSFII